MSTLLLIEDDPEIRQAYRLAMSRRGHTVLTEATGTGGLLAAADEEVDAIILDAMLPDLDGFEVCRRIRTTSGVPIIMLTARDSDADIVGGLEAGADDYVVKPIDPAVLDARIRALLRRSTRSAADPPTSPQLLVSGHIQVDVDALTVSKGGRVVAVSPTELRLLIELMENRGRVLSRTQLLASVWGTSEPAESRVVDATVQRLRAKVDDDPGHPTHLQTVRGFGYRWD